jgi:ankyrin repeat protein
MNRLPAGIYVILLLQTASAGQRGKDAALIAAAQTGRVEEFSSAIAGGGRLSARDASGRNAFMWALDSGHLEVAISIMDRLDLTVKSAVQRSLNTPGVWKEIGDIGPLLLAANERIGVLTAADRQGWTPLMLAAARGYMEIVQRLIADDVPTDPQNSDGLTAAAIAEKAGHDGIAALLTAHRK